MALDKLGWEDMKEIMIQQFMTLNYKQQQYITDLCM